MQIDKQKIKHILNIAIPSGVQSGLDVLISSISLFFLGQISNLNISAVGIGFGFILLFFPLISVYYIGTNAQCSFAFGEKKYDKLKDIFSTMLFSSIILSIPTVLLAFSVLSFYVNWFDSSEEVKRLAYIFAIFSIFSLPAMITKNIIISAFASIGDTKRPLIIKCIISVLAVILNYILIIGAFDFSGLGIIGAGISNIFISYFELFLLIVLLKISGKVLKIKLVFYKEYFIKALKIGIPTGIERFFTLLSISIILKIVSSYSYIYGDSVLIGFQAGSRIEALSFVPGFGFMVAAMALMGQNLGSRNYDSAKEYMKLTVIVSSITLGILGILLIVFSKTLSEILIKEDSVAVEISIMYLIAVGFSQIPLIISFVYDGALRGAKITKVPLYINISSIIIFRLIPMYICVHFAMHLYYIFLIIFLETYIRAFIFYFVFSKNIWIPKNKEKSIIS